MNSDHDPFTPEASDQGDLKAQEDLLALKVLGDPHFLERVPYLMPVSEDQQDHIFHQEHEQSQAIMDALTQEVKVMVLAELDLILPELISSCLSEVLSRPSPASGPQHSNLDAPSF